MTTRETASRPGLQDVGPALLEFWAGEGCLLVAPCDFGIPAATHHPQTFFGLLAPEPWRAAYVQPVRRPLDGRGGEHPYRLSRHLQLEVVLDDPPPDLRELYLASLDHLGFELAHHDLRFADWRFRSRALGAWGSGWHVLLDGLGITRLTYLREIAGRPLEPAAVEITYGLERLGMLLTGAANVHELDWAAGGPSHGELRRREEEETARYAFEVASAEDLRGYLEGLAREARRSIEAGLPRPAYELAVRGLQAIDLLAARGELAERERDERLDAVRELVEAVAAVELEGRVPAKRAPAKGAPAKGAPTKGGGSKRAASKRAAAKGTAAKGTAAQRAAAKRAVAQRDAAKRAVAKRAATKRASAQGVPAKRKAPKRARGRPRKGTKKGDA